MTKTSGMLLTALLSAGCPQRTVDVSEGASEALTPAQARDEVLVQLNERAAKIVDFRVKGRRCIERCDQDDGVTQSYEVRLRAPGLYRLEIPEAKTTTTFDGKRLVSLNHQTKTAQVIDLEKAEGSATSTLPYQLISGFLTEGWRPPLLGTVPEKIRPRFVESAALPSGGQRIIALERPLQDERLSHVEYWFRSPRADFVHKRFVLKGGAPTKEVEVEAEHKDPRTGYRFPQRWRTLDENGTVVGWHELTDIQINTGVPKSDVTQDVPPGYAPPASQQAASQAEPQSAPAD